MKTWLLLHGRSKKSSESIETNVNLKQFIKLIQSSSGVEKYRKKMPTTCEITFDNNPMRVYVAGQVISGRIEIILTKLKILRGKLQIRLRRFLIGWTLADDYFHVMTIRVYFFLFVNNNYLNESAVLISARFLLFRPMVFEFF